MALPKKIEEQARRAEELQQKQIDAGTSQPEIIPPTPAPEPPKVEPPKEPPKAEPEIAKPAISDGPEPKEWEHRYRVLQGKYNSEVPRLQQDNRQLRSELQALRDEVDGLRRQPPTAKIPDGIKPEEVQQYGEEFVDFVKRVAGSVATPQVDMTAVDERIRPVEEATVRTLRNSFFKDLDQLAPNWEALNTDSKFLEWLTEDDDMSGRPRQSLFDDAYKTLDARRVAAIFNKFGGPPAVGAAPTPPPVQSMVTPSTSRASPPTPPGKKIWRQSEIAEFFNNVRMRRYGAEEAAKIEADIFAAQLEGRVR